jgi:hypothetical protein
MIIQSYIDQSTSPSSKVDMSSVSKRIRSVERQQYEPQDFRTIDVRARVPQQ